MSAITTADAHSFEAHETEHAGDPTISHSLASPSSRNSGEKQKFEMWNVVDQYDEKHVIAQSKQMKTIDKVTGHSRRSRFRRVSVIQTGKIREEDETHGLDIPENMKLNNGHVQSLLDHFVSGKPLHIQYAQNILKKLHDILSHTRNVVQVSVPRHGVLTCVGDTHGQLSDLHYIISRQGLPSKTNYYLFNGDFVDRGAFGCEVFLTVAAMKIANPHSVFMNRGNHESERYNIAYGFEKEVRDKFDAKTFSLFEKCFNWLPLAHVVNKSVFVVHAGLPR